MIWPMLRGTRYHFFKKMFPKIDFVKTVSVTIIANSKKMKMKKKSHPHTNFAFPLVSRFWFPLQIFKKLAAST